MMPSCDQTGVPGLVGLTHFHSSTTSGSASLMSVRILLRVSPRQSPSSAILFEMSSDADWPWLAPDFFMFSSWKFQTYFICKTVEDSHVRLQSNVTAGVDFFMKAHCARCRTPREIHYPTSVEARARSRPRSAQTRAAGSRLAPSPDP